MLILRCLPLKLLHRHERRTRPQVLHSPTSHQLIKLAIAELIPCSNDSQLLNAAGVSLSDVTSALAHATHINTVVWRLLFHAPQQVDLCFNKFSSQRSKGPISDFKHCRNNRRCIPALFKPTPLRRSFLHLPGAP
ncbi:hypothetical protein JB92DRAFT_143883 [Gautieria morchelliformis]|nr:hypothetical protein JB92DRAFT_143883 [Gautieria morchelliformis]